jgi:DNA-binding response OmpR family regulator
MRILLIEDEPRLSDAVRDSLLRRGYAVDAVATLVDAEAASLTSEYDAMVLDLGLPDGDGISFLGKLRQRKCATPIVILTARDSIEDRVAGLDAGADDYLVKPFAMPELIARLNAVLRRPAGALGTVLEAGNIRFDTTLRNVEIAGSTVGLSRRELTLLENLMRRAGRVVAKEFLEERIYGHDDEIGSNSLEVLVHRLRRKLADGGASGEIHTVRGVGYLLMEPSA